ncbi:MAG: hypothetical protein AB7U45_15905 [Desulfamplus sp.]
MLCIKKLLTITLTATFLLVSGMTVAEADLSDGLVAYYPFDGDTNDQSLLKNHGMSFGNIKYVKGIKNQAAYFIREDYYILIPHNDFISFDLREEYSISLWVYLDHDVISGQYSKIFFKGIIIPPKNWTAC